MRDRLMFLGLGLVIGVVLMLALGVATGSRVGRYQIAAWDNHIYTVDTVTGQLYFRWHGNALPCKPGTPFPPTAPSDAR